MKYEFLEKRLNQKFCERQKHTIALHLAELMRMPQNSRLFIKIANKTKQLEVTQCPTKYLSGGGFKFVMHCRTMCRYLGFSTLSSRTDVRHHTCSEIR